jgi:dihydropyrimidinase
MFPRKGSISIGADADLVIWDANKEVTIAWENLHDNVGYTPYEGKKIRGWPLQVFSRGRLVVDNGELKVEKGTGEFIPREKPSSAEPLGRTSPEAEMVQRYGFDELW